LLSLFNAYIPINAPKATMSIPLASTEWGGLNRPSNPNWLCHQKSKGPAVNWSRLPITANLSEKGIIDGLRK
jgi:hypothetical protein